MAAPDLTSLRRGLPLYFSQKLDEVVHESNHPKKDLLEAEASRYRDAALLAEKVKFNLVDLLQLGQKTPEEQLTLLPELSRSSHSGGLHSATFLSAIAYCCHENEENRSTQANLAGSSLKLPLYFTRKLQALSAEEGERLLPLFDQATRIVETCNFKVAAVMDKQKSDLYSEVALLALRYVCYAQDTPGAQRKILTGSRINLGL